MNVLVVGSDERRNELKQKLHSSIDASYTEEPGDGLEKFDLIFDLNLDDQPENLDQYAPLDVSLIGGAAKLQLAELMSMVDIMKCRLIGMNSLPTFINREKVELSLSPGISEEEVSELMEKLQWEYTIVKDRVGLVTPRIVLMIINEACYTLQEGTAEIKDIDRAMKLGTAYPFGPFEWADKIGIEDVYETLEAIYHDSYDERYRVCPLLKTMYLENKTFYSE